MHWRPSFNFSSQGRQIALGIGAVLLPISVLAFMQYRSLADLESKTNVAVKENLRQTLQVVERRMEERFEAIAKDALLPLEFGEASDDVEKRFTAVVERHPEIRQLFFISECCGNTKHEHSGYFFTRAGLRLVSSPGLHQDPDAHSALRTYERARLSGSYVPKSGQDFLFWQNQCPTCLSKEEGQLQTYIFRTVRNADNREPVGFVGLVFHTDYIKQNFLAQRIPEVLQSPDLALADSNLALGVFDESEREIYATTKGRLDYEVKTAFSRPFPQWEMRLGLQETTIGALARASFQKSLGLTLLVLSVLAFGILQILRASAREMKLAQAKSDFVSNVSHELKSPLTMIRLFAEILSRGRVKNPAKAQEYCHIIEHESLRLSQLIDNILDFSRMEAGRKNYQFVESDAGELVTAVIKSYEYQLINSGFEIEVGVEPNLPAILVDPDAISQAVLNLLNNAVKYSDKIKQIGVRVFKSGESIAIEVSDRGLGIPRSEHQKIFEKFHRVGTALVHNTKGSGLGLSLVKHIVDAHRGQIRVESEPGQGSRFTLLLPLSDVMVQTENARSGTGGYEVAESLNN